MADISNGSMHFVADMDNSQLKAAYDETIKRVQGLSDAVVKSGDILDETTQEMVASVQAQQEYVETLQRSYDELNAKIDSLSPGQAQDTLREQAQKTKEELDREKQSLAALTNELSKTQQASKITATSIEEARNALGRIGATIEAQESEIAELQAKYEELGKISSKAFEAGRYEEYFASEKQRKAISGEITTRQALIRELRQQSNVLETQATKMEQNATKQSSFRTQLNKARNEMRQLVLAGKQGTEEYEEVRQKVVQLTKAMKIATKQTEELASPTAQFQGFISGLSGVTGAFSAAQGAMALFSGANEDLQKVMLKVQSLMSITMGLQQVSTTLNENSAFQQVTLNNLKAWWNKLLAIGRGEQVKDTAATQADTVAKTAQATATTTATTANIGLAGAFRMVGAAIKSIPVFGWIVAGISALVAVITHFSSKAEEARKKNEELFKSIAENAYKPIGSIEQLSREWNKLGDDFDAKKKFVEDNKEAFNELGVAIRGVADAENLLIANKENFIQAQIAKAKAMTYREELAEKYKEIVKAEAELEAMPDKVSQFVQTNSFGGGYYQEIDNSEAKEQKKKEIEDLQNEIRSLYDDVEKAESEALENLKKSGISGTKEYEDGMLGAIENAISKLNEKTKTATNATEYNAILKDIENLQKQADAITGGKKTTNKKEKDPYLEMLKEYKAEYERFYKYVNSGNESLVKVAKTEFASLIKEGATYMDFLQNKINAILAVDESGRTDQQRKELSQLYDALASESNANALEAFNNSLSEQLNLARNVVEQLNIIQQRRQELANDGTELDTAKSQSLDEAETDAKEQLKNETEALLAEYASFVEQKRRLEEDFNNDVALLMRKREQATTDAEKSEIDSVIKNRTKQFNRDVNSLGGNDYDTLLKEYGTFEEKKQAIIDEYDEKRQAATVAGNTKMIEALNEAQAKALSQLASSELMDSEAWVNLFGNLDELTAQQIDTLITEIENKFDTLSVQFDPIDLAAIRSKLNEARDTLYTDNPFKQIGIAIKEIFSDAGDESKDSADKIKKNWTKLGKATEKSFEFVTDAVNSCDFLKDAIGDVGATAISSMAACAATAITVATAIKSVEKASVILAIIQAALVVVQAVVNVVKSILGNQDKKIEEQIENWKDAVDDLSNAYTQLSWEIDRALGNNVYKTQQAAIRNLQEQQALLQKMWKAEQSKKDSDDDKVREYQEEYADLARQIEELYEDIASDILQTDAKTFADELGDALVDAFKAGEDAAEAFEETVNDVLKNAIVNQLKKKFLEEQLQSALDSLESSMGYWAGDNFVFSGLTDAEIEAFKKKVQAATDNFNEALEIYSDLFKDLVEDESLTGAVSGVTEETASIIAGQMNAIRINQLEATSILRQSLQSLSTIAQNTSYNRYLARIERIITILETNSSSDSLRSQGLS